MSLRSEDASSLGDCWSLVDRVDSLVDREEEEEEEGDLLDDWELEFESKSVIGNLLEEIYALQEVGVTAIPLMRVPIYRPNFFSFFFFLVFLIQK